MTAGLKGDVKKTPNDPTSELGCWFSRGRGSVAPGAQKIGRQGMARNVMERDGGVGKKVFSTDHAG